MNTNNSKVKEILLAYLLNIENKRYLKHFDGNHFNTGNENLFNSQSQH